MIGTGGIFVYGQAPQRVLAAALFDPARSMSLRPRAPRLLIDAAYLLYAVGLLAEVAPTAALRLAKASLLDVTDR